MGFKIVKNLEVIKKKWQWNIRIERKLTINLKNIRHKKINKVIYHRLKYFHQKYQIIEE